MRKQKQDSNDFQDGQDSKNNPENPVLIDCADSCFPIGKAAFLPGCTRLGGLK